MFESMGVRPLVCQDFVRAFVDLCHLSATMGLCCCSGILGESLGYEVVTLSGQPLDFQTRQPVMMLPLEMQEEIQSYIYERKRT